MPRVLLLLVVVALGCTRAAGPQPVQVAAASDLTRAFEAAASAFTQQGGPPVRLTFGSSGLLGKQLREGAPFDLFAAADARFIDDVVASGACDGATRSPYGRGRVVAWSRRGSVEPPAGVAALAEPRFARLALPNPEHAPYGRAAKEALERAGVWSAVAPRLVFAENVRQALQIAETGNADVALTALALVVDDHENPWVRLDEALHEPLEQVLVVCTRGRNREGGRGFAAFLASAPGRAILRRHGFELPGEPPEAAR